MFIAYTLYFSIFLPLICIDNRMISFSANTTVIIEKIMNIHYKKEYISRKHTELEYITGIINCIHSSIYWNAYNYQTSNGTIKGATLNSKHREYIKKGIYKEIFNEMLSKYIEGVEEISILHTDTTFVPNKKCKEKGRNKFYKSKNGIKISTLLDENRVPVSTVIKEGNRSDTIIFGEFEKDKNVEKLKEKIEKKGYITADKGYCSKKNRGEAEKMGYKLLCPLKKNMKGRKMTKKEERIYKGRIKVENYYAHIKQNAKIMCVFEREIKNYEGIVNIVNIKRIDERMKELDI